MPMPRSEAHVDRCLSILSVALTIAMLPLAAHAQSILDRTVGKDGDRNLVITQLTGPAVGALAAAAGVPAGIEIASVTSTRITPVMATGRTVREVADALTAADPRYAWRCRIDRNPCR
jgi:hypothetical protein